MSAEATEATGRRLKTWKEIAGFFGCDERTVKRWEETRGLPVRRLPNGSRSAVFAYENELRAWLDEDGGADEMPSALPAELTNKNGTRLRRYAVATGIALCAALALVAAVPALSPLKISAPPPTHHINAEAQKFYLAGVYGWQSRTPAGLTQAVDDFTQAIVRDPQYAKAYAGLADCYNLLREYTAMPANYAFPRAKAAAERAVALDPSLADAHAALAFVDFYWSYDTSAAHKEFETAIRLAPGNATTHHWYAIFLVNLRKFPQALAEIERAQRLDPTSGSILADRADILFYSGRTDEAISILQQLERTQPQFTSPHLYLAAINHARGDDQGFVRELSAYAIRRQDSANKAIADAAVAGLARGGHKGMLLAMLTIQQKLLAQEQGSAYLLAQTHAQLGNSTEAIRYLKLSFQRREPDVVSLNLQSDFRSLQNLAEFRQLVLQAGLEPSGT